MSENGNGNGTLGWKVVAGASCVLLLATVGFQMNQIHKDISELQMRVRKQEIERAREQAEIEEIRSMLSTVRQVIIDRTMVDWDK